MQENPKVCVDTSVLIAAVLSPSGGSFYILTTLFPQFDFFINDYILEESLEVLQEKFSTSPKLKSTLFLLLGLARITIMPPPSLQEVYDIQEMINKKDAPILASALKYGAWLLTLDEDFLQETVCTFAKQQGLEILKPKDFILSWRATQK